MEKAIKDSSLSDVWFRAHLALSMDEGARVNEDELARGMPFAWKPVGPDFVPYNIATGNWKSAAMEINSHKNGTDSYGLASLEVNSRL